MVKGSKSDKEATYDFRDIVLAKVRGYPPWPGMVCPSSISFLNNSLALSL
jgi:PWWP domain